MSTVLRHVVVPLVLIGAVVLAAGRPATSQQPLELSSVSVGHAASGEELRRMDAAVNALTASGDLVVATRQADRFLSGRVHEHLVQRVAGIPVLGGGITRQLQDGVTVSLAGSVDRGIAVDTTPRVSAAAVGQRLEQALGARLARVGAPRLVILPLPGGSHALAWQARTSDHRIVFVDAADGRILRVRNAFYSQQQPAVGSGVGVAKDRKKIATTWTGSRYEARDRLRPGEIVTLDSRQDDDRFTRLVMPGDFGVQRWTADDIASDDDNNWTSAAVVDHHAHLGWVYDYLSSVLNWQGLDGNNRRFVGIVNLEVANAFFFFPPAGPEGTGVVAFGADGDQPLVNLDIVGHEVGHAVIHFSARKRFGEDALLVDNPQFSTRPGPRSFTDADGRTHTCPTTRFETFNEREEMVTAPAVCTADGRFLLGSDQAGAVHEAYADILAEATAYHHRDTAGTTRDYLQGSEDEPAGVIRSMVDPGSLQNPAAWHRRMEFALLDGPFGYEYAGPMFVERKFVVDLVGGGYGASHWNSLILSHAWYLAIEGGTNKVTGMTVAGAGAANSQLVERIFFRAVLQLTPERTSLPDLADAIRQSAADMAAGTPTQRAINDALLAVGLGPGTTT